MAVPFLDLKAQYEAIREEVAEGIQGVLDRCAFAGGPFVAQFEEEFAAFCGARRAAGVGSGTDALWLSLLAMGVGPGDEVITVPNTFIATVEAISFCGATPVFVDVDETTFTLDPNRLEAAITERTKAVIPVHLFGQPADMAPILEIARGRGIRVIEDACQAHGAEYGGKRAGSLGDAGCFSFYPGKNLGAYGEAGAVVSDDEELMQQIEMLRDHGQSEKYKHARVGWNCRMDGFQGAILSVKLKRLPDWTEQRRNNAAIYDELLANVEGVEPLPEAEGRKHAYHLYEVHVANRAEVMKRLGEREIACGLHYPTPIHLQDAYASMGLGRGSFPVAERGAEELLSLPMFPELTRGQIEAVVEAIASV